MTAVIAGKGNRRDVSIIKRIFPFLSWFERYDRVVLRADFASPCGSMTGCLM